MMPERQASAIIWSGCSENRNEAYRCLQTYYRINPSRLAGIYSSNLERLALEGIVFVNLVGLVVLLHVDLQVAEVACLLNLLEV